MQIVSNGDNLHEMSDPVFWGKKENILNFWSAGLARRVVKTIVSGYAWQILPSFVKGGK